MRRQFRTGDDRDGACGAARSLRERDRIARRVAERQHGVLTRAQLRQCGFHPRAIDRRVEAGQMRPLHRGVYLIGAVVPPLAPEMAAVLSCGPAAVLSHRSAAVLWRLLTAEPGPSAIAVTVPARDPGAKPGVRVHRVRRLASDETTSWRRIPVTTPERTLLDLAAVVEARRLEQAMAQGLRRRLVTRDRMRVLVDRHRGRLGIPALRSLLVGHRSPAFARSEAEERFLRLIREAELPSPEVNVRIGKYEVDFLWQRERLIAEVDGYAFHADPQAFERDRLRDSELAGRGYRVIRITWRQIVGSPTAVLARVATALARESPDGVRPRSTEAGMPAAGDSLMPSVGPPAPAREPGDG